MDKFNEDYKRLFASFSGKCPYNCRHCYTFIPNYDNKGEDSINKIVNKLQDTNPDVIYISGHKENFIIPSKGIGLGEILFNKYNCDILMTTRNVFNDQDLKLLSELNAKMKNQGKNLFFCISIPALDSYKKLESNPIIPKPYERIEFLSKIYANGIDTFLTIKPLCPSEYIPINEVLKIIEECKDYSTVILSSGIVVDNNILRKLKGFPTNFSFIEAPLMECLDNNITVKYIDVSDELLLIKNLCLEYKIPFFEHSIPAIKYVKSFKKRR